MFLIYNAFSFWEIIFIDCGKSFISLFCNFLEFQLIIFQLLLLYNITISADLFCFVLFCVW